MRPTGKCWGCPGLSRPSCGGLAGRTDVMVHAFLELARGACQEECFSRDTDITGRSITYGAHLQPSANGAKRGMYLIQPRLMLNIQNPVHLGKMPTQTPCQLHFADTLIFRSLMQNQLHGRRGGQSSDGCSRRRRRYILACMNARRDSFFERIYGPGQRFLFVVSKSGEFGKVRTNCQCGTIIFFEMNWISKHYCNPKYILILATGLRSNSLGSPCIGSLGSAIAKPDGQVTTAAAVGVMGTASSPGPSAENTAPGQ